jgi:malonyl-CoA O-methyltransferase
MTSSFSTRIIRDFSRAAQTYDRHALLQRKVADQLFNRSAHIWQADHRKANILDIGCGTGYFHELLRKNKIYTPIAQLDISHEMCKIAASYASLPEYGDTFTYCADMHNLPFAKDTFSSIFSSMTLQWADGIGKCLLEAKRVLAPKGSFAFSLVGEGSIHELTEAFCLAGHAPPIHHFINKPELDWQLKHAGFSVTILYQDSITLLHRDFRSLIRSIKGVGASYKNVHNPGLKGKNYFIDVETAYRNKFSTTEGLPLSWNIIYAVVENA